MVGDRSMFGPLNGRGADRYTEEMTDPIALTLTESDLQAQAWHELPVARLCKLCNPLGSWSELDRPVTRAEVKQCIREGRQALVETPLWTALLCMPAASRPAPEVLRDNHIRKVAWFVINGVRDAISLDVGVPSMGCWVDHVVDDGHHRLAGAWIRGDKTIRAQVSGARDHARDLGLWNPNAFEAELQRRYDLACEIEVEPASARPRRKQPSPR